MDNGASSYRRFLDGDDTGIVEIIRDYKDGLTLYINGLVCNIFIAEELMEEVFFKLVTKKPRYTNKYSFKTWLYTIGRNMAIDYIRHNSMFSNESVDGYENFLIEEETVEESYLREERRIVVHKALSKLKPEYRQILYLIYFEDFNNSEAAIIMKKNKHQIENLIYRARLSLKSQLNKEGFVYEDLSRNC